MICRDGRSKLAYTGKRALKTRNNPRQRDRTLANRVVTICVISRRCRRCVTAIPSPVRRTPGGSGRSRSSSVGLGHRVRRQDHRKSDPDVVLSRPTAGARGGSLVRARRSLTADRAGRPGAFTGRHLGNVGHHRYRHTGRLPPRRGLLQAMGESSYVEHGGRQRRRVVHLTLEDARPLPEPIPCRGGAQGLWVPPADIVERCGVTL